jgi:glycosyltransferase involved in cell wall biosynthesis
MSAAPPLVSVIVRSYNRLPALCELLDQLLAQDHDSFEVVVVEQSTVVPPVDATRLRELEADPRLRVLRHPPLGGARARNVGVAAARGEIILLIDDDDLPWDRGWIRAHLACLEDPRCLAVSGRHMVGRDDVDNPYPLKGLARRNVLGLSPLLRLPRTYVRQAVRRAPVACVMGSNAALRRSALARFGGWDEDTTIEDEASFAYRAARLMRPGEYFAFDPRPIILRRLDVAGGLDKRQGGPARFIERMFGFVHHIIGRYHPVRLWTLYPLYLLAVAWWAFEWVWTESSRRSVVGRLAATALLVPLVPAVAARSLYRLWTRPRLSPPYATFDA